MNTPSSQSVDQTIKAAIEQHVAEMAPDSVSSIGIAKNYIVISEVDFRETRGLAILQSRNMTPWLMDGILSHALEMIEDARMDEREVDAEEDED